MIPPLHSHVPTGQSNLVSQADLFKTFHAFEAVIVSQMLQASGINKPLDSFGGGTGEDQFASFLTDAQAAAFVARGGIGLAEQMFRATTEIGSGR